MSTRFLPTLEQRRTVEAMAGYGVPQEDICHVAINPETGVPICPKTLRLVFRRELDTGSVRANVRVARSLYEKAIGNGPGAVTAAIWWTKCRMGWKETSRTEVTGPDGGPVRLGSDAAASILAEVDRIAERDAAFADAGKHNVTY